MIKSINNRTIVSHWYPYNRRTVSLSLIFIFIALCFHYVLTLDKSTEKQNDTKFHFNSNPNDGANVPTNNDLQKILEDYVAYLASLPDFNNHDPTARSDFVTEDWLRTPAPLALSWVQGDDDEDDTEVIFPNDASLFTEQSSHYPLKTNPDNNSGDLDISAGTTTVKFDLKDDVFDSLIDQIIDGPNLNVTSANDIKRSDHANLTSLESKLNPQMIDDTTTVMTPIVAEEDATTEDPITVSGSNDTKWISSLPSTMWSVPNSINNATISTYKYSAAQTNKFNQLNDNEKEDNVRHINSDHLNNSRVYTTELDWSNETDSDISDYLPLSLITSESQISNIFNDTTRSNNFNTNLTGLYDTELLRELKRTRSLLHNEIEKLKSINSNLNETDFTTELIEIENNTLVNMDINQENAITLSESFGTSVVPTMATTTEISPISTTANGLEDKRPITTTTDGVEGTPLGDSVNEEYAPTTEADSMNLYSTTFTTVAPTEVSTTAQAKRKKKRMRIFKNRANSVITANSKSPTVDHSESKSVNTTILLQENAATALLATTTPSPTVNEITTVTTGNKSIDNLSDESVKRNEKRIESNEPDIETMILTHVPKITIIHKIKKPLANRSSADASTKRKTLQKHSDIIRSTVSSISLYPAAFKQYRINQNNKVNSVGEIYLLPNITGLHSSSQYLHYGNGDLLSMLSTQLTKRNVSIANKPKKRLNAKVVKFTYKHGKNKFNSLPDHHYPQLLQYQPNSNWNSKANISEGYTKLRKAYYNNILLNGQSADNMLQIYRPRLPKRFKKIRLPYGFRAKKDSLLDQNVFEHEENKPKNAYMDSSTPPLVRVDVRENNGTFVRDHFTPSRLIESTDTIEQKGFKIFCSYDAHRSLSILSNDTRGQFFDINLLEQHWAVLELCTHLIYAFANVDMNGDVMAGVVNVRTDDDTLRIPNEHQNHVNLIRLLKLKEKMPRLRILAAVGGWDTPPQLFSLLVATAKFRERLSQNLLKFVLKYDFDGVIIAWFYPSSGATRTTVDNGRTARSTTTSLFQLDDKQNLIKFIKLFKSHIDLLAHKRLQLGIMVPPFEELINQGFEVDKLSLIVDHLILMTFDYYGSWEDKVHHFSPMYPLRNTPTSERDYKLNINYTLSYWVDNRMAPREKTLLSVAFYGRSFTLKNASMTRSGAPSSGPGIAGPFTNTPGLISFNELCEIYLGHQSVRLQEDQYRITANVQLFDQWIGFDDELSLYYKTKYAIENGLSGIFVWPINYDDYRNKCGWGRFPLLKAINKAVEHCGLVNTNCANVSVNKSK